MVRVAADQLTPAARELESTEIRRGLQLLRARILRITTQAASQPPASIANSMVLGLNSVDVRKLCCYLWTVHVRRFPPRRIVFSGDTIAHI
jgi:hypothetical protein